MKCPRCEKYDAYIETITECLFEGIKGVAVLGDNIRRARQLSMELSDEIKQKGKKSWGSGHQVGKKLRKEFDHENPR